MSQRGALLLLVSLVAVWGHRPAAASDSISFRSGRKLVAEPEEEKQNEFRLSCSNTGPFPFMAHLKGPGGEYRCGAVLIRPNAVLTAAACVDSRIHGDSTVDEVYLGGFNADEPIEIIPVSKPPFVHESFNGDPVDGYNIALLKLERDSCLSPIPNIGRQTDTGESYLILGFGRTGTVEDFAQVLQVGNVTNFDYRMCNREYGVDPPLDEKKLCSRSPACDCAAVCEGDEGGPVFLRPSVFSLNDTLIGIMSYSDGECSAPGSLSIHTDIQPFENWIRSKLISDAFVRDD